MSGQLRALRNRIRSVENTKKITRAMEMVAAAKLRRFQDMMQKSRAYTDGLESLLMKLNGPKEKRTGRDLSSFPEHPFIKPANRRLPPISSPAERERIKEGEKTALVLIASDAGLCGSYNNDLINLAMKFLREQKSKPLVIGVGKSGITALKSAGFECQYSFTDVRASRVEEILNELRDAIETLYLENKVDAVYVVYSHFKTLTAFKSTVEKLLPLTMSFPHVSSGNPQDLNLGSPIKTFGDDKKIDDEDYIFEPSPEAVFQKLIPQFFQAKMRLIFLESVVSEQIARMTAMNQATKNAKEMIDGLVLKRNKARQASITKELIEIVSGSKALKLK